LGKVLKFCTKKHMSILLFAFAPGCFWGCGRDQVPSENVRVQRGKFAFPDLLGGCDLILTVLPSLDTFSQRFVSGKGKYSEIAELFEEKTIPYACSRAFLQVEPVSLKIEATERLMR
jgi:hypothetical protein